MQSIKHFEIIQAKPIFLKINYENFYAFILLLIISIANNS